MRHSGYEEEIIRSLSALVTRNHREIECQGKLQRPRVVERDLRVMKARSKTGSKSRAFVARGITWRSFEFFHFWLGYGF